MLLRFRLEVMKDASGRNRTLTVKCYAKEPRGDDVLGEATVDITETLQTGEFDGIFLHVSLRDYCFMM